MDLTNLPGNVARLQLLVGPIRFRTTTDRKVPFEEFGCLLESVLIFEVHQCCGRLVTLI